MEQLRVTDTPLGQVTYTLTRKRVKNWNLRIREEQVLLSVPLRVSQRQADEFIRSRAQWIFRVLERQKHTPKLLPEALPRPVCMQRLTQTLERMYPRAAVLGIAKPQLRLRKMRSQWGNCHYQQGYITLNTALAACPQELQDYVCLHELVHFIHPDHGRGFYETMDRLMPDWNVRRSELKKYRL